MPPTIGSRPARRAARREALALAALLSLAGPGVASADDTWQTVLRLQLNEERRCVLTSFVFVRELPIQGLGALEGRVRCHDGREFEFSRQRQHQHFELHLCQPAVC